MGDMHMRLQDACLHEMMSREGAAGQRFPHGSQQPEQELSLILTLCETPSASSRVSAQIPLVAAVSGGQSTLGLHCYSS